MEGKDTYKNEYSMNADVFSFVCCSLFLEVQFFPFYRRVELRSGGCSSPAPSCLIFTSQGACFKPNWTKDPLYFDQKRDLGIFCAKSAFFSSRFHQPLKPVQ